MATDQQIADLQNELASTRLQFNQRLQHLEAKLQALTNVYTVAKSAQTDLMSPPSFSAHTPIFENPTQALTPPPKISRRKTHSRGDTV